MSDQAEIRQLTSDVKQRDAEIDQLRSDVHEKEDRIRDFEALALANVQRGAGNPDNRALHDRINELEGALANASCLRCFSNRYSCAAARQEEVEE